MTVEYKQSVEKKKEYWIGKLKESMKQGDTEKAYMYFQKLVKCKMVNVDRRWSNGSKGKEGKWICKYSELKKEGEELEEKYGRVWMTESDIPDTIYNGNPIALEIEIESKEHWTERVELVYRGDILAPAKKYRYRIGLVSEKNATIAGIEQLKEMYKRNTGKIMKLSVKEDRLEQGFTRIYSIDLGNGQEFKLKKLGYLCVNNLGKNGIKVMLVMETKEMETMCIDVISVYKRIIREIKEAYKEMGVVAVSVVDAMNIEKIGEEQRRNKKEVLSMSKFIEMENRKLEKEKETEKEA